MEGTYSLYSLLSKYETEKIQFVMKLLDNINKLPHKSLELVYLQIIDNLINWDVFNDLLENKDYVNAFKKFRDLPNLPAKLKLYIENHSSMIST